MISLMAVSGRPTGVPIADLRTLAIGDDPVERLGELGGIVR